MLKRLAIGLGCLTAILLFLNAAPQGIGATAKVGLLGALNASASVSPIGGALACSADISGAWLGRLAFQVIGANGIPRSIKASTHGGSTAGASTTGDGSFVWQAPGARTCQVTMASYSGGNAKVSLTASEGASSIAQAIPSYVTWYNQPSPWPTPITGADVGIGGALGSANLYNLPLGSNQSGLGLLGTGSCYYICFGAPGYTSHHVLSYGNDVQSGTSFTTQGAPDDCGTFCPGGIANQIFSITLHTSPLVNNGYIVAADGSGNFGVYNNIIAGAAIVAGAGDTNPSISSGITSLAGGVRPNGASGGYAPEAFPVGSPTPHPQMLSGTCVSISSPVLCQFPNSFSFTSSTSYYCTVSALGNIAIADSYVRTSASSISVYSSAVGSFSYICLGS